MWRSLAMYAYKHRRMLVLTTAVMFLVCIMYANALPVKKPEDGDGAEIMEVQDDKPPDFAVKDERHPDKLEPPRLGGEIPKAPPKAADADLLQVQFAPDPDGELHGNEDVVNMHQDLLVEQAENAGDGHPLQFAPNPDGKLHGDKHAGNVHEEKAQVDNPHEGILMDNNVEAPDVVDHEEKFNNNLEAPDVKEAEPKISEDVELPDVADAGGDDVKDEPADNDNVKAPDAVVEDPKESDNLEAPDAVIDSPKESDNLQAPDVDDGKVKPNRAARLEPQSENLKAPKADVGDPKDTDNVEVPDAVGGSNKKKDDNLAIPDGQQQVGLPDGEMPRKGHVQRESDIGLNDIKELKKMEEDQKGHPHVVKDGATPVLAESKLTFNELKPPDHLDAVHLEADGHLNRDYKKEIFFGNHEEMDLNDKKVVGNLLRDIFNRADLDNDAHLSAKELTDWIQKKVMEHFNDSAEENEHIFNALDRDKDGFISWKEFHVEYLIALGNEETKSEKHAEDYDTLDLDLEEKERLIRYKFRWADADEDPQDNQITLKEFHYFRHPEQSPRTLNRMVEDIIENIDANRDFNLTEEEFSALPEGEVDEEWKQVDKVWQQERRKEFRTVIDRNKDGVVTYDELKFYVDPRNPNHAMLEARNLIQLADNDKDNKLSLKEVLGNMELFLGSKMVDIRRSFHDEF